MNQVILSKYVEVQTKREKYCVSIDGEIKCKGMDKDTAMSMANKLGGGKYVDLTERGCSKVEGRKVCVPEMPKPIEKKVEKKVEKVEPKEEKKSHGKDK